MKRLNLKIFFAALAAILLLTIAVHGQENSDKAAELRKKIETKNSSIADLEKEISAYQDQIDQTSKQTKTLESAIKALDLTGKKLVADIALTENKISSVSLMIDELALEIGGKEVQITDHELTLSETLRQINEADGGTFLTRILQYKNISDLSDDVERLNQLQFAVGKELLTLRTLKSDLESNKTATEKKQKELVALKATLADQKKIVEYNKSRQNELLRTTKSKETNYKKMLADKVALRDAFAAELLQFESELQFVIDPTKLPQTGSGVLSWPLDQVKITQYFGNTEFAMTTNAYNGNGHNGIDLRATIGTVVKSSGAGIVRGTGNTDTVCPGASYGRWILIEHQNGLSTLYAHLSLIKVSEGQSVQRGELIGYSGDTGYATGPHLHFTVYATEGVRVMDRKSRVCQGAYRIPVADLKAYLNPLLYL